MFQKFFASLLTYAIGFQLIVGAIPHSPLSLEAYGQTCGTGLQWNEMVGRCLSTEQAAQFKEGSQQCDKLTTDAEKKNCYKEMIDGKLAEAGKSEKGEIKSGAMNMLLPMASLISAALFLMTGGPSECPGATSAYLMMAGALAVIAGEIMSGMTYKKKIEEAQKKFEEHAATANGTNVAGQASDIANSTSTQAEAFQAMIEMEEAVIAAAKQKNMLYMIATAAYAAATVLSGIETIQYYQAKAMLSNPATASAGAAIIKMQTCVNAMAGSIPSNKESEINRYAFHLSPTEAELKDIQNQAVIFSYLENFFEKKQNLPFSAYSSDNLKNATNLHDLFILNQELTALKKGENVSVSYETYVATKEMIDEHFLIAEDQFSLVKLGTILSQQFTIPSASAAVAAAPALASAAGTSTPALTGAGAGLKKLYMTPMSRLVLAGVMTVNNVFMINKTNAEKKKAEDRKKFIEGLKQQVIAAGAAFGCSSTDRSSNLSRPECYCYQEGGTLNPSRANSKTCSTYFGGAPNFTNDNNLFGTDTTKTCMTSTGAFDAKCSCKTSNTCAQIRTNVSGNVPGAANLLGNLPQTLNGLNSGALSAADVNAANMNRLAAASKKAMEKLLADPKNKALALQAKKAKAQGEKILRDLAARTGAPNPMTASTDSGRSSGFMGATSPSEAFEKMKEDLKQDIKGYEGGVVNMNNSGAKKDDFSLDGLNVGGITIADEGLENQDKLDEIMAAQYEMGDSEIHSDPGANIFQILTNRYQRSGMRRLFGAEKVVPADKPIEAPIAQ
jgi:hypothetical protein